MEQISLCEPNTQIYKHMNVDKEVNYVTANKGRHTYLFWV